jgi:tripartite-type tricarboxylate transporter receptor subunit TctC
MSLGLQPKQSYAQAYPSQRITLVVSFSAGGFVDTIARAIGQKLSQRFGQPVIIENRSGAAGNIAHRLVANAKPDGYTLLAASSAVAINESLYKSAGYHGSDFAPVALVASTPLMLINNARGPGTLKDVLAKLRTEPTNFGTAGVGTPAYIVTEYFLKTMAKVEATHVPFQGGTPLLNAILSNHIDLAAIALAGGFLPHIKSGSLRGLVVAGEKRFPLLPEIPTYAELGYDEIAAQSWAGIFAPANTPADIVEKLNASIQEIMKDPEIISHIVPIGYEPMYGTQSDAAKVFRKDIAQWKEMIDAIGLRIE